MRLNVWRVLVVALVAVPALCALLFGAGHAGESSVNYHPCLWMEMKAQEAMGDENTKAKYIQEKNKSDLDEAAYDEWYACDQVRIYHAVLATIKRHEQKCLARCKTGQERGCEDRVEALYGKYRAYYEFYINKCPNPEPASVPQSNPDTKDKVPGRNTMTFHD